MLGGLIPELCYNINMSKIWRNSGERGGIATVLAAILGVILVVTVVLTVVLINTDDDSVTIIRHNKAKTTTEHADDTTTSDQEVKELKTAAQKFCDEYNAKRTNESKRPILENMDASQGTKTLLSQSGGKWQIEKDKLSGISEIAGYDEVGGPNMKYVLADQDCWDQISGNGKYAYSMSYDFAYQAVSADSAKGTVFSEQGSLALLDAKGNVRLDTAAFRGLDVFSYVLTGATSGDVMMTAKDDGGKVNMSISGDDTKNLTLYQCQDFAVDNTDDCTKVEIK